ncbi:MAG TPA: transporter substrate-binding domain-containing protein [Candidatus Enterocloster faecavium]|uniref:Transporter substrate-binding domain-containing protein n=1 Tax=Candidatus Enterocloster faecavium TaxID=2838560 RepID=A0A9D2RKR4_9FIRM|nr:transporter substrate-binding domain-containing protein [Candidatus Enterocloster faecavium]
MKKKLTALTLAVAMAATMAGCSGSGSQAETEAAETTAAAETEAADPAAEDESTEAASEEAETEAAAGELKTAQEGKLVMVTNAEFPPYEYHEGDEIVGIDAEIAAAIADKLGLELVIEDIAFDSIIPELVSGKADFAMAGMTVTDERKQSVDFSNTYAKASQKVIVQEGSDITTPDDLTGKIVGVQLGTTGDLYVTDLEAEGTTVERFSKGFEAVQALSQGKVDAVVIDEQPAQVFVSQTEGLVILDDSFTDEEYAAAVKKGNTALLNAINDALAELDEAGELDAIVAKYITAE